MTCKRSCCRLSEIPFTLHIFRGGLGLFQKNQTTSPIGLLDCTTRAQIRFLFLLEQFPTCHNVAGWHLSGFGEVEQGVVSSENLGVGTH